VRCPDGAELAAWVDGEVVGLPADAVECHVARCHRCTRAARAERQVKRRTVSLRVEAGSVRPAPDLLSVLMTVPQAEHDRALRRAHRASCGNAHNATRRRVRVAVVGAAAAVWLVAAVWTAPVGTSPGGSTPVGTTPVGTTRVGPPSTGGSVPVAPARVATNPTVLVPAFRVAPRAFVPPDAAMQLTPDPDLAFVQAVAGH